MLTVLVFTINDSALASCINSLGKTSQLQFHILSEFCNFIVNLAVRYRDCKCEKVSADDTI